MFPFILLLQRQLLGSTSLPFELNDILRIVKYKGFESLCLKISSGDRNASLLAREVLTRPRTPNLRQK